MYRTRNPIPLLASLIIPLLLAGCLGASESYIQGSWVYESLHLKNLNAEQHLTVNWVFDGGSFYHRACCFNIDLEVRGRYRVMDIEQDIITLELYDVQGSASRFGGEIRLKIDRVSDTLNIQGAGPYTRLLP